LLLFLLLKTICSFSQISYVKELEGSYYLYPESFVEIGLESSFLAMTDLLNKSILFLELSSSGLIYESKEIFVDTTGILSVLLFGHFSSSTSHVFMVNVSADPPTGYFSGFFLLNEDANEHWGKILYAGEENQRHIAYFLSENKFMTSYGNFQDGVRLAVFDLNTQEVVWARYYKWLWGNPQAIVGGVNLDRFSNGDISVLLQAVNSLILLRLTPSGDVVKSRKILLNSDLYSLSTGFIHRIDSHDNIYLAFKDIVGPSSTSPNDVYKGVIMKLDSNYEQLWTRVLEVEHFQVLSMDVKVANDDNLFFICFDYYDLPVIYGKVNYSGDLLWHKGFSFFQPAVDIATDGSLYFFSTKKYYLDGSSEPFRGIIAKTDSSGNIQSCPQYETCIDFTSIDWPIDTFIWEVFDDSPFFPPMPIQVETRDFSLTPYCGSPTPPHPYFYLPDTICAGDCLTPDSTYNRLAHQVEWYITGPGGLDTTIIDTTFTWCFDQPGHYQIEQGIWLLGCSDYFLRDVEVLPNDLAPALGEDRVLCEQPPYSLSANASRPLTSYLWNNGSTAAELEVTSSGTYWLEASDGYCILRDTVQLTFLDDLLTQGPALSLPTDTSVCEQHLPYELLPQSPYAESFSVPAISNSSASSFELWQAGSYEVQAELFGCPIRDTFALEVNDCRSRIYFPTAFSPNGDGLNDLFLPQGKDYQGIELQIYDRWGGLLFSSQSPPFAWDGGDAAGGVYVYRFRYWNTLALQEEEVSGQVVLLR